jgi:endonuclease YncB( thermonuclease family)
VGRVPKRRALAWLGIALLWLASVPSAAVPCAADRLDAEAEVASVLDGDTVVLADGRRVRLLGINAPELAREERPAEPFSSAARRELERLLQAPARVGLRYEEERSDRYGRTLAHVFLADGTNVQKTLLERGLAAAIALPPNGWAWECYRAAETSARRAGRGIWGDARFRPRDARQVPEEASGFWVVTGRVARVGESGDAWWLNLPGGLALRLPKEDLAGFGELAPRTLRGRQVEGRGWIQRGRRDRWITVRHPAALAVIE